VSACSDAVATLSGKTSSVMMQPYAVNLSIAARTAFFDFSDSPSYTLRATPRRGRATASSMTKLDINVCAT